MPRNNRIEKLGMNVSFMWYPATIDTLYPVATNINILRLSMPAGVFRMWVQSLEFPMADTIAIALPCHNWNFYFVLCQERLFFSTSFGRFHRFVTFKLSRKKNFPCSKLLLCAKQREYLNTYAMRCTAVATTVAMVASKQPHKVYCVGAMCMSLNVFVKNRQWNWNCNMLNSQLNLSIDSVETP